MAKRTEDRYASAGELLRAEATASEDKQPDRGRSKSISYAASFAATAAL